MAKAKKASKATKSEPTKDDTLQEIGRRAFESIAEMVARLDAMEQVSACCAARLVTKGAATLCYDCERPCTAEDGPDADDEVREKAQQEIQEDPLSVQVRSGWYSPGEPDEVPAEFEILLSTGGPATRIVGELDASGEPTRARLEAQDWHTPWTEYRGAWGGGGEEVLLAYARQFYYAVS